MLVQEDQTGMDLLHMSPRVTQFRLFGIHQALLEQTHLIPPPPGVTEDVEYRAEAAQSSVETIVTFRFVPIVLAVLHQASFT